MTVEISKDYLVDQYLHCNKSVIKIAKESGHDRKTITRRLQEFGIAKKPTKVKLVVNKNYSHWTVKDQKGRKCTVQCRCGHIATIDAYSIVDGKSTKCEKCAYTSYPTCVKNKRWKGHGEISGSMWARVTTSARKRKKTMEISIEEAWNLFLEQDRKCKLTGLVINFGKNTTASLDRIDSKQGYQNGNLQWVHKIVNKMKNNLPQNEFISFCRLISTFNK